jgi:hypothetical protein
LSEEAVMARWERLFNLPLLVERYRKGDRQTKAEINKAKKLIEEWRQRLKDISWFMRCLNEHIARRANEEDQCKGRYWEGRFKSQALLDEAAVLTCMSYVDLNPIRAGIADTPEESDYTSIQQRIQAWQQAQRVERPQHKTDESNTQDTLPLMSLTTTEQDPHPHSVSFTLPDYLELIDWVGRAQREDKRGAIDEHAPPILERLGLDARQYLAHVTGTRRAISVPVIGHVNHIKNVAQKMGRKFLKGLSFSRMLYQSR